MSRSTCIAVIMLCYGTERVVNGGCMASGSCILIAPGM